jgi:hypothetical protein
MRRHLAQVAASLVPRSVEVADAALCGLSRWILASTSTSTSIAAASGLPAAFAKVVVVVGEPELPVTDGSYSRVTGYPAACLRR